MICFFYCTEDVKISHRDHGIAYEHFFEGIPNKDRTNIPLDKVYFSTPSDFHNQMENIRKQVGERDDLVYLIDPKKITSLDGFPKDIGYGNLEENVAHLKGKPEVKIAIVNAMSNAVGDHLIGMQAFDYWLERLSEILYGSDVKVSFFQLNPFRVGSITKQWEGKIDNIYMLPHKLPKLGDFDAFIDLGTLLLREGFDTEHMIDFFFKALSIDAASVPPEKKRMKYNVPPAVADGVHKVFQTIRWKGRPILLFHRTSTAPVRDMAPAKAREVIAEIIQKTDYFVISADGLDYQNKRFIDISSFSRTVDDFAAIISKLRRYNYSRHFYLPSG